MENTFRIINQMVTDGVIENYAVGGAIAVSFYLEPDTTFDLDIFCVLTGVEEDAIDLLRPIYDYLTNRGYVPQGDGVSIEGFRVQFLPVFNELNDDAVRNAVILPFGRVPVRVMGPEYLLAIMLQTGRPKDYARIARFLEAGAFDPEVLTRILSQHGLEGKWKILKRLERSLGT